MSYLRLSGVRRYGATGTGSFGLPPLPHTRHQHLALWWIIRKALMIPGMVSPSPGHKIGNCPGSECQAGQRPCGYSPPNPQDDFTKVIGAGYPAVQLTVRNLVAGLARLTETAQRMVCSAVNDKTSQEEPQSEGKPWVSKPSIRVATRESKDVATVEVGVRCIEQER